MAKTKFLTTIPQKVAFGGLVVVTVLAVAWGIWMSLTRNPTTISDDSIREEITPVVKLVTYEYNFTQLLSIDEAGNPLGWENPFTSKRYVATIDGKADIGIDADKMKVTIVRANMADKNSEVKSVKVILPHSEIASFSTDPNTLKKYVEDNGFLNWNQVSTDDLNTLLKQAKKEQTKKVKESNMLQESDDRACALIEKQVKALCGDDVNVDVAFE
ncbi:DUF4230 domain-containing protein [Collinsella sp. AM17-1]|uniref:DUF4230 domain-containing protein n=1 Tax=Collinsella sp. AM17-1 TaxID=2292027 RepID=UPI000E4CD4D3|nr:DUF4230 domain-containing protein [Collinsella sp. AM17-1]RHH73645.1 DUF4230 domain-containing protein [Collinsella sp. AM17-1]